MSEIITIIQSRYEAYNGQGQHLILFWGIMIALFVRGRKIENKIERIFVKYTLFFLILTVCPLTAKFIMDYCIGKGVYWRMMWILPVPIVLAFAGAKLIEQEEKCWRRYVAMILMLVVVAAGGKFLFTQENFTLKTNNTKLAEEVLAVCNFIEEDAAESGQKRMKAIMCNELMTYVRQYDGNILMPYGRNAARGAKNEIYSILNSGAIDTTELLAAAKKQKCNYLVYPSDAVLDEQLQSNGFIFLANVYGYYVYRIS